MKQAKKYVNSGDLVAVHGKYNLIAGICRQWTDNTFQYFKIRDYKYRSYGPNKVEDISNYVYRPGAYLSYIRSREGRRVVPIKESYLNEFEQKYYELLKEELDL